MDKEIDDLLSGLKTPEEVTTADSSGINKGDAHYNSGDSDLYVMNNGVLNLSYPTSSHRTSETFGSYRGHTGIDFPVAQGSNVCAAQKGIVIKSEDIRNSKGNYASYGRYIMIYHGTDAKGRKIVTLMHIIRLDWSAWGKPSKRSGNRIRRLNGKFYRTPLPL